MSPPPEDDKSQQKNLIVLAVVIGIVVLSVWLLLKFKDGTAILDCFASGRKNCQPIDMSSPQ
jgi:hypothetical protein